MNKILSTVLATVTCASMSAYPTWPTKIVPTFSLADGIQKTAQSSTGKCLAALALSSVVVTALCVAKNDYINERFGEASDEENFFTRTVHRLEVCGEIFDPESWLSTRYKHIPFKYSIIAGITGIAGLSLASIYNGFKRRV